jgi:hypothetical protein
MDLFPPRPWFNPTPYGVQALEAGLDKGLDFFFHLGPSEHLPDRCQRGLHASVAGRSGMSHDAKSLAEMFRPHESSQSQLTQDHLHHNT